MNIHLSNLDFNNKYYNESWLPIKLLTNLNTLEKPQILVSKKKDIIKKNIVLIILLYQNKNINEKV